MKQPPDDRDTAVVNRDNAEHYVWGDGCDGWHLLKSEKLSVIEERVPPGAAEVRHYHERAQQFFYILDGEATMELAGDCTVIKAGRGIAVPAGVPHRLANEADADLRFLVVSAPRSHGDRVVVDESSGGEA